GPSSTPTSTATRSSRIRTRAGRCSPCRSICRRTRANASSARPSTRSRRWACSPGNPMASPGRGPCPSCRTRATPSSSSIRPIRFCARAGTGARRFRFPWRSRGSRSSTPTTASPRPSGPSECKGEAADRPPCCHSRHTAGLTIGRSAAVGNDRAEGRGTGYDESRSTPAHSCVRALTQRAAVADHNGQGGIMSEQTKYLMGEEKIPHAWYNIIADLPSPPPPVLHPGTGKPVGPDDLSPLFPMALIGQEVNGERHVEIPQPVRDIYRLWRPTPLYRARRLEKALGTSARIFYKYEGVSPAGSHKPNTAVAQAFYNKQEGVTKLSTETGAGQWGSSLAFAGALFGLEVKVYMVKVSYNQKPYRRALMETYGAKCVASPSDETESGRAILKQHPDSPGSLGIAISEAVEVAAKNPDTKYALGSVLNHVLMHQTVIGIEAIEQMEAAGAYPDIVIGCAGGGSNFAGIAFPFIGKKLRDKREVRAIAVEPAACPSMTRGRYAFDFGDTGHLTPLVKMHTLGSEFIPPGFHA